MNVSRTRSLTINMGNYGERYQAAGTATLHHSDLGFSDEEWLDHVLELESKHPGEGTHRAFQELNTQALALVNETIEVEIAEAVRVRDADEDSFLDRYEHPEPPRRTTRRKRS